MFGSSGARRGAWKVAIVITDQLSPSAALREAIINSRAHGIRMYGVGIQVAGRQVDPGTLYDLSLQADVNEYQATFVSGGYSSLAESIQPLLSFSCVDVSVASSLSMPGPGLQTTDYWLSTPTSMKYFIQTFVKYLRYYYAVGLHTFCLKVIGRCFCFTNRNSVSV